MHEVEKVASVDATDTSSIWICKVKATGAYILAIAPEYGIVYEIDQLDKERCEALEGTPVVMNIHFEEMI